MPPTDLMADLTPDQRAAVTHVDGPLLILAGAGSGKTRVITRRVAYLLAQGIRPNNILAITFTNKAANEMKTRVETLVPGNRVWISTFHSLGARLLRQYGDRLGLDKNFTIYDVDDRNKLVKLAMDSAGIDDPKFSPDRIAGAISRAKNMLLTPGRYSAQAEDYFTQTVASVYGLYEKKLRQVNGMDFDDLLYIPALALNSNEDFRAELDQRFSYILIDEYQDTNTSQYSIARKLSVDHRNLCVVGDPDQCLLPGTMVDTPSGPMPIETIRDGQEVISGIGWGKTAAMRVDKVMVNPHQGKIVTITVKGGIVIRATPNHICFARAVHDSSARLKPGEIRFTVFANPILKASNRTHEHRVELKPSSYRNIDHASGTLAIRHLPHRVEAFTRNDYDTTATLAASLESPEFRNVVSRACLAKGDSFSFRPAEAIRPGMIVPVCINGNIEERIIESVAWEDYNGFVYDLSIPETRNFVANGLVVHNSIYKWRGSDIRNILDFERDFPETNIITLDKNYRSTKLILQAASALIDHNKQRKKKSLITDNPDGEPVHILTYDTGMDEADLIVKRIREMVKEGRYRYRDVAIFVRINALTRSLEGAFINNAVPFQIVKGLTFFERKENKDVLAYLRLLVNPADQVSFVRVVNEPPRGIGKVSLEHLARYADEHELPMALACEQVSKISSIKGKAASGLRDFASMLKKLRDKLEYPPDELIREVLDATGYRDMLRSSGEDDDAERLANIEELITAAKQFHDSEPGRNIGEFLEQIALSSDVDGYNEQSDCVSVMTLHASKGLEFPVVFMLAFEQGLLPHERSLGKEEDIEEERRLAFVGITRAMRELYLCHGRLRDFRGQTLYTIPSMFLEELTPEVIRLDQSRHAGRGAGDRYRTGPAAAVNAWNETGLPARPSPIAPTKGIAAKNDTVYIVGQTVEHEKYGRGQVEDISGFGAMTKVKVRFRTSGLLTFIAAQAKLKVVV